MLLEIIVGDLLNFVSRGGEVEKNRGQAWQPAP